MARVERAGLKLAVLQPLEVWVDLQSLADDTLLVELLSIGHNHMIESIDTYLDGTFQRY
jgi:hypothetical protein